MNDATQQTQDQTVYRSGFVAVVGRPNVGKSTLINALIGTQVAIASSRPETTRKAIRGILTTDHAQIVLVDTPGIHRPHAAAWPAYARNPPDFCRIQGIQKEFSSVYPLHFLRLLSRVLCCLLLSLRALLFLLLHLPGFLLGENLQLALIEFIHRDGQGFL